MRSHKRKIDDDTNHAHKTKKPRLSKYPQTSFNYEECIKYLIILYAFEGNKDVSLKIMTELLLINVNVYLETRIYYKPNTRTVVSMSPSSQIIIKNVNINRTLSYFLINHGNNENYSKCINHSLKTKCNPILQISNISYRFDKDDDRFDIIDKEGFPKPLREFMYSKGSDTILIRTAFVFNVKKNKK